MNTTTLAYSSSPDALIASSLYTVPFFSFINENTISFLMTQLATNWAIQHYLGYASKDRDMVTAFQAMVAVDRVRDMMGTARATDMHDGLATDTENGMKKSMWYRVIDNDSPEGQDFCYQGISAPARSHFQLPK